MQVDGTKVNLLGFMEHEMSRTVPSILISEILAFCPRIKTLRERRSALICRFTTFANFEFFVPMRQKRPVIKDDHRRMMVLQCE